MPDGTEFPMWEKPLHFTKTYFVDKQVKNADDNGPGTKERPFRTINQAAQVLQPGERVVIAEGVYREADSSRARRQQPGRHDQLRGCARRESCGQRLTVSKDWQPSEGWNFGIDPDTHNAGQGMGTASSIPIPFPTGYNPFEVDNVIGNRYWINYAEGQYVDLLPAARPGLCGRQAAGAGRRCQPNSAGPSQRSLNFFNRTFIGRRSSRSSRRRRQSVD